MPDNLKKLYDNVSAEYELPDFETFKADMSDDTKRKKLYDAISADYELPSFDQFTLDMGLKKKDATGLGSPASSRAQREAEGVRELTAKAVAGDKNAEAVLRAYQQKKTTVAERVGPVDIEKIEVEQGAGKSAAYVPKNVPKLINPEKPAEEFLKQTPAYINVQREEIDRIRQSFGQRTKGVDFDQIVTDNRKTATVGEPLEEQFKNLEEDYLEYLDKTDPEVGLQKRSKLEALRGKDELLDVDKQWLLNFRNEAIEKRNLAAEATMWDVREVADIDTYQKRSAEIAAQMRSLDRQIEDMGIREGYAPPSKLEQANALLEKRNALAEEYNSLAEKTGFTPELQSEYFGAAKEIIGGEAYVRGATAGIQFPDLALERKRDEEFKKKVREAADVPVLGALMGGITGGKMAVENARWSVLQIPKIIGDALGDNDYDGWDELYSFAQENKDAQEALYGNPFGPNDEAPTGYSTARLLGEGVGSATMFIAGGQAASIARLPQIVGTVGTAFMTGTSDFYEDAIAAGMNQKDAARYAIPASAAVAFIEGIVPDAKYISPSAFRKSVIRALTSGKPYKEAIKEAFEALPDATRAYVDSAIKEGFEEGLSQVGTDVAKEISNTLSSNKFLDVWDEDAYKTAIMSGALTGGVLNVFSRPKAYKASPEQEEVLGYAVEQVEAGNQLDPETPSLEVVDMAVEIKRGLGGTPTFGKLPVPVQNHVVSELLRKQQLEAGMKASGVQPQSTLDEIAKIDAEVKGILEAEPVKETAKPLQVDEDVQRKVAKPLQEEVVEAPVTEPQTQTDEAAQRADTTPDGGVGMRTDGMEDAGEGGQVQPPVDGGAVAEDALKDVESTAKGLTDLGWEKSKASAIAFSKSEPYQKLNKFLQSKFGEEYNHIESLPIGIETWTESSPEYQNLKDLPIVKAYFSYYKKNKKEQKVPSPSTQNISEAYHAAKKDGSNPELVKVVEELLGKPTQVAPSKAALKKEERAELVDIDDVLSKKGKDAAQARREFKEKHGEKVYEKARKVTVEFDKIITKLEQRGIVRKDCP